MHSSTKAFFVNLEKVLELSHSSYELCNFINSELSNTLNYQQLAVIQCSAQSQNCKHKLIYNKSQVGASSLDKMTLENLGDLSHSLKELFLTSQRPEHEISRELSELNITNSCIVPLLTTKDRIGVLLLLGIDENINKTSLTDIKTFSKSLALGLLNALNYEDLDTKVKVQNAELSLKTNLFDLINNNTQDFISIHDKRGKFIYTSPSCKTLIGYDSIELIGQDVYLFHHPEDTARIEEHHKNTLIDGVVEPIEFRFRKKDGSYIWFESISRFLIDENHIERILVISRDITLRRENENQVKQGSDIFKNIQLGMYIFQLEDLDDDKSLTLISANPASEKLTGKKAVNILGKRIDEGFPELKDKDIPKKYSEVVKTKKAIKIEDIYYNKNKEIEKIFSITAFPLPNMCVAASYENITEKRLNEIQIQQSANIFEGIQLGIYIYHLEDINDDRTLRMLAANPSSEKLTGVKVKDCIGKTLDENFPGLREKGIPQMYAQVVRSKQAIEIEDIHYQDERVQGAFAVKAFPLPNNKVGVGFENITRRKKAEQELKESEERFKRLTENSVDIIYRINFRELKYDYINQTVEKITGYTPEEMYAKPEIINSIIHPDFAQLTEENFYSLINTGIPTAYEFQIIHKSGEIRWIYQRDRLVSDQDGKPLAIEGVATDITKRKEQEIDLRVKETALNTSINGIVFANLDGKLSYANETFLRMWGYDTLDEVLDTTIIDFWNDKQHAKEIIYRLLEKGSDIGEIKAVRKNKTLFDVKYAANNVIDQNGKPICLMSTFIDVTQQKEVEKALVQSEKKYRGLFNSMLNGFILCKAMYDKKNKFSDSILLDLNPAFEEFTKLKKKNALGKKLSSFIPNIENEWFVRLDRSLKTGRSVHFELFLQQYNKYFLVHAYKTETDHFAAIFEDISARKYAEDALNKSVKRYRDLVEQLNDWVWEIDTEANFQYVSPKVKDILGYEPEELYGKNAFDIIEKDNIPEVKKEFNEFVKAKAPIKNMINKNIHKDGHIVYIESNGLPILNELNELIGYRGVDRDVTERFKAQEELNAYKNHLKQLVKVRTDELEILNKELKSSNAELQNANDKLSSKNNEIEETLKKLKSAQAQLIHAEKMASLGVLTAGIAHEINNPVNFINSGVIGLTGLMEDVLTILNAYSKINDTNYKDEIKNVNNLIEQLNAANIDKDILKIIKNINEGINRTIDIIKSLQAFSRSDHKDMQPCNVHENIENTLTILQNQYKNRIEIIKNYGKASPINCYQSEVNQVLMNILANAIQAIHDKGTITITTKEIKSDNNNYLQIIIHDTGSGIDKQTMNKIFEPFFTTKKVGEGTGLGLAISYSIIEKHKGQIKVKSEPGNTEFTIEIPYQEMEVK